MSGVPSYINVLDALTAWELVREAGGAGGIVAAASFKHVSPAGAAVAEPPAAAYSCARDVDPKSSFGDLVAVSEPVDTELAAVLRGVVSVGIASRSDRDRGTGGMRHSDEVAQTCEQHGIVHIETGGACSITEHDGAWPQESALGCGFRTRTRTFGARSSDAREAAALRRRVQLIGRGRPTGRDGHDEASALRVDGLHVCLAAHRRRELVHDGEPDTGADDSAGRRA